ncbi:type II secretion system F family protein [Coralloluteibacterium stylophorae]|uniref:Type II secretion system F family protein n=1 Tax=Coralloluteibacterium stylophorae TaxID=1776034 RepID=A0A8J8AYL2_9GAMM|nr:type II secretion system F family protein [Coralloluteibacterium stylophorae]MBS7457728.1 type II secretion system F family protein [Coralloluteibacterium stylophorae]
MATIAAGRKPATTPRENPLSDFVWTGVDKRGTVIKGETQSKSVNLVKAELRRQGITPRVVKAKPKPLFGKAGKSIKPQDIAIFSRQLATMMQSGVPMVQALDILASGQKNPRIATLIGSIRDEVSGGSALSEALSKHPLYFDDLYQNLVRSGEGAGVLDTVLDTIATYKERIEALKGKIKKALFYPAAVMAVAILVSCILLIFVIPQFQSVFQGFGADLPAFTQMLVNLSEWMQSYWWLLLLVVAGSIFGLIAAKKRSRKFAQFLDRMVLKIPVIGQIMHQSAIARFARTLGITFRAGVPLVEALETVSGATGNIVYENAVRRIREDVAVGYPVNMAMKQVNLFPHMVVQMTAIGEEAGALDTMLFKVAEFYEQEVNNAVDALTSLLEPLIMVVIGVVVGSMVVGMYLPIFKLAAAVG